MKLKLTLAILLSLIITTAISTELVSENSKDRTECSEIYDKVIEGEKKATDIPDKCEPLPEDIENQILAQALMTS